jgi:hypothetical protein
MRAAGDVREFNEGTETSSHEADAGKTGAVDVARARSKVEVAFEAFVSEARAHTANQHVRGRADAADDIVLRSPWARSVLRSHWAGYWASLRPNDRRR